MSGLGTKTGVVIGMVIVLTFPVTMVSGTTSPQTQHSHAIRPSLAKVRLPAGAVERPVTFGKPSLTRSIPVGNGGLAPDSRSSILPAQGTEQRERKGG